MGMTSFVLIYFSSLAMAQIPAPDPNALQSAAAAPRSTTAPTVAPTKSADDGKGAHAIQAIESYLGSQIPPVKPTFPKVSESIESTGRSCQAAVDRAQSTCLESLSPILQSAMATLSGALSTMQAMSGTADPCAKQSEIMDAAQKAMTAYNGACTATKMMCTSKCDGAKKAATAAKVKACKEEAGTDPVKQAQIQTCVTAATKGVSVYTVAYDACNDYQKNMAAGGAALGGMLSNMMAADQCQKDAAVDCVKDPTNGKCPQQLDCNLTANASNPRCICEVNPRSAGCAGSTALTTGTDPNRNLGLPTSGDASSSAFLGSGTADVPGNYNSSKGSDSSLPGSPGGGGAGGLKGGGLDSGKAPVASGLNTNILSGEYGGGASGGGSRGSSSDSLGKYGAYLPKKNERGLAGKLPDSGQVTGSAGLSNWEKVKMRYKDNKPSLLSN